MSFITLVTIYCVLNTCSPPGNNFNKVTIPISSIAVVQDFQYYWANEGIVDENSRFVPNPGATKMSGCYVKTKQDKFYFLETPCDNVRKKLR